MVIMFMKIIVINICIIIFIIMVLLVLVLLVMVLRSLVLLDSVLSVHILVVHKLQGLMLLLYTCCSTYWQSTDCPSWYTMDSVAKERHPEQIASDPGN